MKRKILAGLGAGMFLISMATLLFLVAMTGYGIMTVRAVLPWEIVSVMVAIQSAKVAVKNE